VIFRLAEDTAGRGAKSGRDASSLLKKLLFREAVISDPVWKRKGKINIEKLKKNH
jgi:hypothetical protein